ncbi:MAG: tetratricopeptide repeat protein [Ignavibacteriae bacterium]|nr:tetratricopeptide repeat protein [Ignavibacteriota bacterium]NOG96765.1 tetratricopeptide repeat protein [Ignavibacteriota bacterium]
MIDKEKGYFAKEYLDLALQLQLEGKIEDAIETYKKSIEFFPTTEAYTYLGWAYSLLDNFEDAIAHCKTAIEIDPNFGNPYNDIGSYLIQMGREQEAIAWLEKAITARKYSTKHFPYYNLGKVFELAGEWKKAMQHYDDALTIKPDFVAAKNALFRVTALLN